MIKWVGKTVSLLLVFCLLAVMIPVSVQADTGGNVCEIVETGTGYATLDDALAAVESGQTIKLLDKIDYNKGIKIINKSITFDLNGFTLNVTNIDDTTSADDPYLIANATQLASISKDRERLQGGYHFKQIADIDLGGFWSTGRGWEPIGAETAFLGVYDGNGHTISNLSMSCDYGPAGLFGSVEQGSEIRNVTLVNVDIKVENAHGIGSLVGSNWGIVRDSNASGKVYGEDEWIGGLVGENQGSVINSGFKGVIASSWAYTGGLVGSNAEFEFIMDLNAASLITATRK